MQFINPVEGHRYRRRTSRFQSGGEFCCRTGLTGRTRTLAHWTVTISEPWSTIIAALPSTPSEQVSSGTSTNHMYPKTYENLLPKWTYYYIFFVPYSNPCSVLPKKKKKWLKTWIALLITRVDFKHISRSKKITHLRFA